MAQPVLKTFDNGRLYSYWSEAGRVKRVSMKTKDPLEARRRFGRWLLNEAPRTGTPRTFQDAWERYWTRHVMKTAADPKTVGFSWKALQSFFSLRPPILTQDLVDAYVAQRKIAVTPGTIRRELAALLACLNWNGLKPETKIVLPAAPNPRDRWLTAEEIGRLLGQCDGLVALFVRVAIETGAREAAILDLTWDRVDFDTNVIHFDVPGRRLTKKRRAAVPISKALRPHLVAAAVSGGAQVFGKFDAWRAVNAAAKRAGLTGVSPHVLRHTAATHMARRGVPLWKIAKILGNSLAIVEKVYAKHCPDDLRDAVDTISGA